MVLKRTLLSILIILTFSFFAAGTTPSNTSSSGGSSSSAPSTPQISDAECKKTLECWGEKHMVSAAVRCREPIERLAKNDFEWTDGILEPKFSHYNWKNKATGELTYFGDKIKYQNGFGAWVHHTYQCDLDSAGERVTAVRAAPGRLPQ
jgi:hypothetical protein